MSSRIKRDVCKCEARHVVLYGVVSLSLTDRKIWIHAVDRSKELAERHKKALDQQFKDQGQKRVRVYIEEFESDHLFASSMGLTI